MFAGLDAIDWAALDHAYGPAAEVPEWVRGLVSADPAEREIALDAMEGCVHHQGSVYDSTVAVIPFLLEAVAAAGAPGRGEILELLGSIGGAALDVIEDASPLRRQAADAVAEACPVLLRSLTDADADVRKAAATALPACRADAERVVRALVDHLSAETDPDVRHAVVSALGTFARRAEAAQDVGAVASVLAPLMEGSGDPRVRLAALTELVRLNVPLPPDIVATAADLVRAAHAVDVPEPEPVGFTTNTMRGFLREAKANRGDARIPERFARTLSEAWGDRVRERSQVALTLLTSDDWECRYDALQAAGDVITGLRGDHSALVEGIGARLADPHPRLRTRATESLSSFGELAAPVTDSLAALLAGVAQDALPGKWDDAPAWIVLRDFGRSGCHPALAALARSRDERALAPLRWVVQYPEPPSDTGGLIGELGHAAAALVPLIRQRLRDLPADQGIGGVRAGLVAALGKIGPAAAVAVPDLLAMPPTPVVARVLGELGPAATEAIPALRALLDHAERDMVIAAATALWRIEGDASVLLPVFARYLDGDEYAARDAANGLAMIGPAAEPCLPRIRAALDGPDGTGWNRLYTAKACWRITADTETTVPALVTIWPVNAWLLPHIVGILAEMGPAARPAEAVLRAELADPRREIGVREDEALLTACASVLARWSGSAP